MHLRLRKLFKLLVSLIAVGTAYAVFVSLTHISVPCVFNLATGLKCPGCGVTNMCLCILHFDIPGAWKSNPALLCLMPVIAVALAVTAYRYVKSGNANPGKYGDTVLGVCAAVLIVFGILRNIYGW